MKKSLIELPEEEVVSYALPKRNLKNLKVSRATRLRHPSVSESDEGDLVYSINFIVVKSGNSSKSITAKCTKEVFQRVYGKQKEEDSVPVGGYANSSGLNFLIFQNKETDLVEAIGSYPLITAASRSGRTPDELAKINTVDFLVQPSGSFEIVATQYPERGLTVHHVPFKLQRNDLDKIIADLITRDGLNPGDTLAKATIASIVGNKVVVEP